MCQHIPAGLIDTEIVAVFFEALALAEINTYAQAVTARRDAAGASAASGAVALPGCAGRAPVRPNRSGQLLGRCQAGTRLGEVLRDAPQAETALAKAQAEIGDEFRAAFTDADCRLPELWYGSSFEEDTA